MGAGMGVWGGMIWRLRKCIQAVDRHFAKNYHKFWCAFHCTSVHWFIPNLLEGCYQQLNCQKFENLKIWGWNLKWCKKGVSWIKYCFAAWPRCCHPTKLATKNRYFLATQMFFCLLAKVEFELTYLDVFCDMKYKKRCFLCQISKDYSMKQNCKRTMNSKSWTAESWNWRFIPIPPFWMI